MFTYFTLLLGAQDKSRGRRWTWALRTGWIVFLQRCSSTVAFRAPSLWLCSAQPLKQQLAKYTVLNSVVLAAADGLFGLYGSERVDELFRHVLFLPPSPPRFPPPPSVSNKPYVSVDVKHHVYLLICRLLCACVCVVCMHACVRACVCARGRARVYVFVCA